MSDRTLRIERWIHASPDRILAAFERTDVLARWWCPPGHRVLDAAVDFRVGGRYRIEVALEDNDLRIVIGGVFHEIERPKRLVFSHAFESDAVPPPPLVADFLGHESLVTVTLHPRGRSTLLELVESHLPSGRALDLLAEGWPGILDRLAAHAEDRASR